jgi:hypothetical protein
MTNGTLLTEDMSHFILNSGLHSIRFSVDGVTKKTFEKIRRQNGNNPFADPDVPVDYDSVMNNILRFVDLRSASGENTPKIGVRSTDFKATEHELTKYRHFWEPLVDFVEIAQLSSWSGTMIQEQSPDVTRHPCHLLWDHASINWDGTMASCCIYLDAAGDRKGIVADVSETGIQDAFYCESMQQLRRAHLNGDLSETAPFCMECPDWRCLSPPGDKIWTAEFISEVNALTHS